MSLYKGNNLISGAMPNSANQSLSNLNSTGQAVIDSKANTDLSNLSATGKTVISGSWVNANATIGSGLNINGTTPLEFTIGDIPNDGHQYEALISAYGTTSSTSGQICEIQLYSGKIYNAVAVCRGIPRTNTAIYISGNIIMPMAEDRKLYLQRASNYYGSVSLYIRGYRRIGSNT